MIKSKEFLQEFDKFFKCLQEDIRLNIKYTQMLRDIEKELK